MSRASRAMAAVWRASGLDTAGKTDGKGGGGGGAAGPAVYTAAVYSAYACACAAHVFHAGPSDRGHASPQIRLVRQVDGALLFVTSTVVYWCAAVHRREHCRTDRRLAAVERQLFGRPSSPGARVTAEDACCWTLYALLAAAVALDVCRYAGPAPWTYAATHAAGNYALLTGNVQFAVAVLALRRCYAELNGRMRAGHPGGRDDAPPPADRLCAGIDVIVPPPPHGSGGAVVRGRDGVTTFVDVLDKANMLTMLKYWSDLHWSITQIVSSVNNLFKFRLFVFFLCGLLHLTLTPYVLSLIILNDDTDILRNILEYTLWFTVHILRVILMIYPCALLEEEAAKTQIILASYLNVKIDYFDIKRIETYVQHLAANKPEFSIYSMFVINNQLVITLSGAVATYLVIILQLQSQS